ncbi:MAG: helix-turn-helix transcriptional regulator [Oscillospiraceae bacterium]|nr:helix-turn-helix transcriptional regulator [Oscillospiraceae bacterium]
MNFQKIREVRKAAGKSQEELAEVLGVNRATVSKYETGVIEPSVSQLVQIAKFFGIHFREFLDDLEAQVYEAYSSGFDAGVHAEEINNLALQSVMYDDGYRFTEAEVRLVNAFSQLNDEGQQKAVERVEELTEIPKYKKEPPQD